ncbi:uncharacterized protein [Asterias amurensis]|uniref:uncharacterized protein n=1 Tax=Asterias amurensis TaxID=7602 RepID=UPI003AB13313
MNVIHSNLDFPSKMESCADCGGQVWNLRRESSFFGVETCVDCGEIAGICQHWLHLYTYLEPHTLMPLSHGIQSASLRFHLEHNASLEIHSDQLLQTPWLETPLSPSAALRNKFGYRCQFAPVWSSTRASQPLMYSRLEGKVTPSQMVTQIHQLQTTPSVSNIQLESCQQQRYPHQLQQSQQKHKQQKPQSLQRKLQQLPVIKPTTASPETPQEANKQDASKPQAKSAPSKIASIVSVPTSPPAAIETISTGKTAATATPAATAVPEAVAPAPAIETGSAGKLSQTAVQTATDLPEAVATVTAIETGSTDEAAEIAAPTTAPVPEAVAPAAQIVTGSTGKASATASPAATAVPEAVAPAVAIETTSTGKASATASPAATAVPEAVAPALAIETTSTGKASATASPAATAVPEAVAPATAIVTVSTGKAAATAAPTAASILKVVASPSQQQSLTKGETSSRAQRSAFSLVAKRSTFAATTSLFSRPPSDVTKTAARESKSAVPVQHPRVETPKPQLAAAALPAGAAAASTTSSQGSSASQQQSEHTSPKQPKQRFSPVTQALDDYLQGINIPSIEQSDLQHPPQGQVVLGQGAHGGVLLMLYNNEHVAVKCVPTGDKDTVDREVRILSVLSEHDSFPNVHGTIEAGQFRAVAMQFIGDEASARCLTLGEALTGSRSLTLDPADWRSIAMNVVDGIKHMHSEGLLHNDIKMDNILMSCDTPTHRWRAYVIDVGVATTTINPRNYVLTSEEKIKYRRFHGHIAPEMVDNAEHQSIQSDIFQLGYVLHSIGQFGAVPFLEQLGDKCKSRDPSERPEMTHVRYCIQNNTFI